MVKKLILIGPPGVGKTSIKQIFFDGQNADQLLKSPLEPTRGNELTIVEFEWEKIAINDLSGQELDRWLTHEQDVFNHADLVLIFLDVSSKWETQIEFVEDLFELLIKRAPGAKVTIFLHKTDLVKPEIQDLIMGRMTGLRKNSPFLFDFHFTSIVGNFFPKFLDLFFESMFNLHIPDESYAPIVQSSLHRIYQILHHLYKNGEISENYLLIENNLTPDVFKPLKEVLMKLQFISETPTTSGHNYQLQQKGKDFYFFIKNYFETLTEPVAGKKKSEKDRNKRKLGESILGVIISDNIGRELCIIETSANELFDILNVKGINSDAMVNFVSMFLSALFSINPTNELANLTEILLKGTEIDYYILQKKPFFFIFFVDPEVPVSILKDPLNQVADVVIHQFQDLFAIFKQQGNIPPSIRDLKVFLLSQIQVINANTKQKTKQNLYDEIHAKEIFLHLDELAHDPNVNFNKIKSMKKQLLGVILNKNPKKIHELELEITKMKKKNTTR
ncbi:MAG: hypothetical protein RBG13Loki_4105 [Promethearchaeota archaeon CR_4]|nr:MAG: hypothetical protein RBG13Loki_4105 [Candidatus Lokiarchaeota archaeon CR_4]